MIEIEKYSQIVWEDGAHKKLEEVHKLFERLRCCDKSLGIKDYAGTLKSMQECFHSNLDYLDNYGGESWIVQLYHDSDPCSFGINWYRNGVSVMQGGLAFHGSTAPFKPVLIGKFRWWAVHT